MKYCPLCRAAYRQGFIACATCGATLIDSSEQEPENPIRLLWIGRDSAEFDLAVGALRDARIPAKAQEGLGGLVGRVLQSESTIHVLQADFGAALEVAGGAIRARKSGR